MSLIQQALEKAGKKTEPLEAVSPSLIHSLETLKREKKEPEAAAAVLEQAPQASPVSSGFKAAIFFFSIIVLVTAVSFLMIPHLARKQPGLLSHDETRKLEGAATAQKTVKPTVMHGFSLSGVTFSTTSPLAVVNGQVVAPGERVGSGIVKEIRMDEVIIDSGGREIHLHF